MQTEENYFQKQEDLEENKEDGMEQEKDYKLEGFLDSISKYQREKKDVNWDEEAEEDEDSAIKLKPLPSNPENFDLDNLDLSRLTDDPEILNTLGFTQKFAICECNQSLFKLQESHFFLTTGLYDYKPLEIFFFNLQRALQIPNLGLSTQTISIIDQFLQEFVVIYEKKKNLYQHLATDQKILNACLKHFNFKSLEKTSESFHKCTLLEANYIRNLDTLNLNYESLKLPKKKVHDLLKLSPPKGHGAHKFPTKKLNDSLLPPYKRVPNFIFGIWEEFFLNPVNINYNIGGLERFISSLFERSYSKVWKLANNFEVLIESYTNLKKQFPWILTKEFPRKECKEVLLKMEKYDSNPRIFKIALVGKDNEEKRRIISWFLNSTKAQIEGSSIQMKYERNGQSLEIHLYLLSSDAFRVCHFAAIIYSDYIYYPNLHAHLKHFVRMNNYCKNSVYEACTTDIQFYSFKEGTEPKFWYFIDWLTDEQLAPKRYLSSYY